MNQVTDVIRHVSSKTDSNDKKPTTRMTGPVKWFDPVKGYGFMVPDGATDGRDVLIHVSCLQKYGVETVLEGSRMTCDVANKDGKLQGANIVSIDDSTAVKAKPHPRASVKVTAIGGMERCTVKWFNTIRGFGFVTRGGDTPDIFVHAQTLQENGIDEISPDQDLMVQSGQSEKGLVAVKVQLVQ